MHNGWRTKLLSFFLLFVLFIGLGVGYLYQQLTKPMPISDSDNIIEIKPNSNAHQIITQLQCRKLIALPFLVEKIIVYQGFSTKLRAGIYQINPADSVLNFLKRVSNGDVLTLSFRIIDGSTFSQVLTNVSKAVFLKYQPDIILNFAENYSNKEGLLLAETYQYDAGSDAISLLKTAHKKLAVFLEETWQQRDANLPYKNSYQMLIAASILEKESAIAAERQLISGVIVNRLNKKMPLQMDPTVIYALGALYKGSLTHQDLQVSSAYNTYKNYGLPPTPIAMVGKEAILAAAHPLRSNYLYFVANGDGSHVFSETYSSQKAAINKYLRKH